MIDRNFRYVYRFIQDSCPCPGEIRYLVHHPEMGNGSNSRKIIGTLMGCIEVRDQKNGLDIVENSGATFDNDGSTNGRPAISKLVRKEASMRKNEEPIESLSFIVLGEPSPEGSTKAFYIKKLNRTVTTHQNQKGLNAWRNRVATEAQHTLDSSPWTCDPISSYTVDIEFVLSRPASIPQHRRIHPTTKPDIDKLVRAINDALTGILFHDDSQVVGITCIKDYDDERRPGAYICVCRYANCKQTCRNVPKERRSLRRYSQRKML